MKSSACILLAATLCGFATAAPPAAPELDRAFVTIPYAELRALWEAGQRKTEAAKPPAAPVPNLVHRAELRLTLGEPRSALVATFDTETLAPGWQTIPLINGDAQLESADAAGAQVLCKDGYSLLLEKPGKTQATLRLVTRGTKSLTPQNPLRFTLGAATVKRLQVAGIPAGSEVRVNGVAGVVKDGIASFPLAGEPGDITVQLAEPRIEVPPRPPTPSQWQTQSQTLVRYAEGRLHFQSRVFAHADGGSGLEMLLALPANAAAIQATGDDVTEAVSLRLDDGRRLLRVRWKTADVLDREVAVTYSVPQSPLAEQWTLQAPSAPEQADAKHLFAIIPADGLELKGDGLRAAVASHRLPQWMRAAIAGAPFVTAEAGAQLALQTIWLPTVATAEAIVTEAKCQLQLVSDGAQRIAATYAIRHQTPLTWRLELPPDVELLSCTIGGVAAQPVQREKGAIDLALPAPGDAAKGQTQVALVYSAKTKPLDPVSGQVALELPRTLLFIERLDWSIALPDAFEISAAQGNVSIAAGSESAATPATISLRKDLCRAERPGVEIFYQRRSLEK
jgi:hypothetical protein